MRDITIGPVAVGPSHPVRVIGELGICHRGDIELAKKMATVCADSGVDFIKFEIYQLESALSEPYRADSMFTFGTAKHGEIEQNLFEAFQSGYLSYDAASELAEHIRKLNVPFFATVCSKDEVDFMMEQGACAVKLSSGEIDHIPLIHYVAQKKIPMFIDSATTYLWEVVRAVEEYEIHGGVDVVVMQNPAGYPAPPEFVDLDRIPVLQTALKVPVGYTCHSPGRDAIMAAIGKGAMVIEKPISPDNSLPYVEYVFSENMEDYPDFVKAVDFIGRAKGVPRRLWGTDEMREHRLHRHGIVTNKELPAGHVIQAEDLRIARPGYGLRPEFVDQVCGMELKKSLKAGEALDWSALQLQDDASR